MPPEPAEPPCFPASLWFAYERETAHLGYSLRAGGAHCPSPVRVDQPPRRIRGRSRPDPRPRRAGRCLPPPGRCRRSSGLRQAHPTQPSRQPCPDAPERRVDPLVDLSPSACLLHPAKPTWEGSLPRGQGFKRPERDPARVRRAVQERAPHRRSSCAPIVIAPGWLCVVQDTRKRQQRRPGRPSSRESRPLRSRDMLVFAKMTHDVPTTCQSRRVSRDR